MVEQPLVVVKVCGLQWFKREINLDELAKLRWDKGWALQKLALHFKMPKTCIVERLAKLKKK